MKAARFRVRAPLHRFGHLVVYSASFLFSFATVGSFPILRASPQWSLRPSRTNDRLTALELFSASESGSSRRAVNATVPSTSPSSGLTTATAPTQVPLVDAAPNDKNAAASLSSFSSSSASTPVPGIGGLGGIVYDVNKLKRNLLQETIRTYKQDLLSLLSSPRTTEQDITCKLGALVQGSAVRTTTDSNLLDNNSKWSSYAAGRSRSDGSDSRDDAEANSLWTLAYSSRYTHLEDLFTPMPTESRRRRRERRRQQQSPNPPLSPAAKRRSGKQAWTCSRFLEFHLEGDITLELPQPTPFQPQPSTGASVAKGKVTSAPYTVDTRQYFGGLVGLQDVWKVCGLTRTNLVLSHEKTIVSLLGRRAFENAAPPRKKNVQVVYLDVNLAVLAETSIDTSLSATTKSLAQGNQHQLRSPTYMVFTKSPAWSQGRARRRRKLRQAADTVRHWLWDSQRRSSQLLQIHNRTPEDEVNRILQELQLDTSSRLRVLKLGQIPDPNTGDYNDQESAWEGPLDPFVHLSADERQELLKGMKIRDIEKAGDQQAAKSKREQGWLGQLLYRRRTWFKKPSNSRR